MFLKHKNEKTGMEKKKVDSCTERQGREGRVETLVVGCEGAYKPNSALMVNGGLR